MEQCVYCQGIYELKDSDANIPKSFCSKDCEKDFSEHQRQINEYFKSL